MLQILEAEFSYTKNALVLSYLIATVVLIAVLLWDFMDVFGFASHTTINYFIFMGVLGSQSDKEKRSRLYALLLPFAILFHATVLCVWLTQFLRAPDELANEYIPLSGVFTLSGITVCVVLIVGIRFSFDFKDRKSRWMANIMLWIIILGGVLLFFLLFKISFELNAEFYVFIRKFFFHSPAVAVAVNLASAALLFLNMIVYTRRKSFLR